MAVPRRRPGPSRENIRNGESRSQRNGTIYLGVTSDLAKRAWEHRNDLVAGFTKKYQCHLLVWYEAYDGIEEARQRELRMKEWKRAWKVREIEGLNPDWDDLFETLGPV